MGRLRIAGFLVLVTIVAAAFRLPQLAQRPMHCDEAVLAVKTGILLEKGRYEYDPHEFHGPTLHYLSLIAARIQGADRLAGLNETTLRAVPAAFGLLLVAAHFLMMPVLGKRAAMIAALLAAISPAMIYYSRYYIHETLFVFFSFGALISLCRYFRNRTGGWAVAAGAFLGLMQVTKETSIVVGFSMLLAWLFSLVLEKRSEDGEGTTRLGICGRHFFMALATAIAVSLILYSSFFSHPRGILDSILAYRTYIGRASSDALHIHPWYYYLQMLIFFRLDGGPIWTEGMIVGLALFGLVSGWRRQHAGDGDRMLVRFLGIYVLLLILGYAAIPYKTPWCMLGFLHGMILLAGVGAVRLFHACRKPALQSLFCLFMAAGAIHLGWQGWRASFPMDADPANPYVYAHTTRDVFVIARQVEALARAHPDGTNMMIQVISRENLWPLPWYLRSFTRVGWYRDISDDVPNAPLILATPDMEPTLARRFYELPPPGQRELYMNIFDRPVELRPRMEILGYAAKTLWDEFQQQPRPAKAGIVTGTTSRVLPVE